ncbi:hypothetical protein [Mycobacterium sp. 236(2023)]|uniref:hypothetical protein n=1 Tax=Mycobacterium sp. 236(2023) TaxID=3038163 RepID=UPI00241591BC|nr:hypothetical protein [Mycobacterium sp. 236(2023)]MDG4668646.1 hypothetical protein [Mycobacterium sp. 236(2023)]
MGDTVQLFGRGSFHDTSNLLATALDSTNRKVLNRLQRWDTDSLLGLPSETVVAELVSDGSVCCPRLLTDQAWMKPATEVDQQYQSFGEIHTHRVPRFVLVVPFEGERVVFTQRASTSSTNPPRVLALEMDELHLLIDNPPSDGAAVRAAFDDQIANIERYLGWSRAQIEQHNRQLRDELPGLVKARREELAATRKLQADAGYPTSRPERGV